MYQYFPELNNIIEEYFKNGNTLFHTISLPVVEKDITNNSIFGVLFSNLHIDNYNHLFIEGVLASIDKHIRERLGIISNNLEIYKSNVEGDNILEFTEEELLLVNMLNNYRNSIDIEIEFNAIIYNELYSNLSKLLYNHIDFLLNDNIDNIVNDDNLISNDNIIHNLYELYILLEIYNSLSIRQYIENNIVKELKINRKTIVITEDIIEDETNIIVKLGYKYEDGTIYEIYNNGKKDDIIYISNINNESYLCIDNKELLNIDDIVTVTYYSLAYSNDIGNINLIDHTEYNTNI